MYIRGVRFLIETIGISRAETIGPIVITNVLLHFIPHWESLQKESDNPFVSLEILDNV